MVIEPGHPFHDGKFPRLQGLPGPPVNDLGLGEAVYDFGERVVEGDLEARDRHAPKRVDGGALGSVEDLLFAAPFYAHVFLGVEP